MHESKLFTRVLEFQVCIETHLNPFYLTKKKNGVQRGEGHFQRSRSPPSFIKYFVFYFKMVNKTNDLETHSLLLEENSSVLYYPHGNSGHSYTEWFLK